jgi:uncharacterized membrane protein
MVKKRTQKASNADNIFILIALIVLNVLFVIHFLIGIIGVIIGFVAGAFGMIIGGLAGFILSLIYPLITSGWMAEYVSFGGLHPVAIALLSIAILCLGGLWMIANYCIIKYFIKAMKWYINLNIRAFKKYGP